MMMKAILAGAAVFAIIEPVYAQEDVPEIEITGYVGGVSDYRDRGLSLSDQDPTLVAAVTLNHKSGFYIGTQGALIDDQFDRDTQLEFYAGYKFESNGFEYDVSAELDSFFGGNGDEYFPEFKASIARDFGIAYLKSGLAYAPEGRWNTPGIDSLYWSTNLELPVPTLPALTIISRLGYDIRQNRSDIWDWSAGLSAFVGDVEFSLVYEDSTLDQDIADDALVLGVRLFF
ncbi:TorF family putative porin [Kordiimonas sp. SCSIO 12610]|uniref:TorF family putative porin n=1 Tax=Kordiimonas sp. SCSIO 12610 TaxID=2829597 RepID=UPI00210B2C37|nr:TorF family putative porin [Kordiimonas sp. SCSIO 12610]UTW54875.1 TorF family putative porin [Kordiimonas sp. SCSIO 12610]